MATSVRFRYKNRHRVLGATVESCFGCNKRSPVNDQGITTALNVSFVVYCQSNFYWRVEKLYLIQIRQTGTLLVGPEENCIAHKGQKMLGRDIQSARTNKKTGGYSVQIVSNSMPAIRVKRCS